MAFIFVLMGFGCQFTFGAFIMLGEIQWPFECMGTEDSLDWMDGSWAGIKYTRIQQVS